MDILDILLDILLKPPQPLMGLFFYLFLNVNFHFEVIDWDIRLKQCVTSHTIDLFFTTGVMKFSSLTSLGIPPQVI